MESEMMDNQSALLPNSSGSQSPSLPLPQFLLQQVFVEDRIHRALVVYVLPVIVFVGTVGNVLSIAVLTRSRMRRTSVCFYLTVLACADTAILYVSAFKTWISVVSGFELLHFSDLTCRTTLFAVMFSLHFSAWLLVLVTGDRFVAVWFPFRAAVLCSARRARAAVLILACVLVLYNGHLFWTTQLREMPERIRDTTRCVVNFTRAAVSNTSELASEACAHMQSKNGSMSTAEIETLDALQGTTTTDIPRMKNSSRPYPRPLVCSFKPHLKFMHEPYEFLKMLTYSLIPFVIILITNVVIVVKLHLTAPIRRHIPATAENGRGGSGRPLSVFNEYSAVTSGGGEDAWRGQRVIRCRSGASSAESTPTGRQRRVTYMLLSVSMTYLVLTAPFTLNLIVQPVLAPKSATQLDHVRYQLLRAIFFLLLYFNHAVNFFLYCLTGKKFRQELRDMILGSSKRGGCRGGGCGGRRKSLQTGAVGCAYSPTLKTTRTVLHDAELQVMTTAAAQAKPSSDAANQLVVVRNKASMRTVLMAKQ